MSRIVVDSRAFRQAHEVLGAVVSTQHAVSGVDVAGRRRGSGRISLVTLIVASLILITAAPTSAVSPRANGKCDVQNVSTGIQYERKRFDNPLQDAIDAASPGETLQVSGPCFGNFEINRDLILKGSPTKKYPSPTLDANGSGTVVTVLGATATLSGLTITNGSFGGVQNLFGTVDLIDSVVTQNASEPDGGGIFNGGTMSVTRTTISGNAAVSSGGQLTRGGGIANCFGCMLVVTDSAVAGNSSGIGAGIYSFGAGVLTITNSSVDGNAGDGIYIEAGGAGSLVLTDSTVNGNLGAGIVNYGADATLTRSAINDNAGFTGGGVYNAATVHLTDSTIDGNTSTGSGGGGILNDGVVMLDGGTTIHANSAIENGGGIYNRSGSVETSSWTGSVSGNAPDDCEPMLMLGSVACD